MIKDAFEYSEKYHTPVLFRPTTRLCHGCASVELKERVKLPAPEGFVKDSGKWVIFPRLSHANHRMIEARNPIIGEDFSSYRFNLLHREEGNTVKGIITHGISYEFVMEALNGYRGARVIKVSTPNPMPERLLLEFAEGLDQVMAVEELDPVLEQELLLLSGRHHLPLEVKGKLTGEVQTAGENSVESVRRVLEEYLGEAYIRYLEGLEGGAAEPEAALPVPPLPVRPPVLCAGCPHRASFYAVKRAMEKLNEGLEEGAAPIEGVTAAISAAIPWAMQSLWIWWTPACAWAPGLPWPRGCSGWSRTNGIFPLWEIPPSLPPVSQVLSMRYTMRPA